MSSFNSVQLMGRLTRDCEFRAMPSGTSVVGFGLAVSERFKDKSGEWQERATFVDVEMFGPRGEAFAKYHGKGSQAFVYGKLRLDQWEKDGEKRSKLKVVADGFEFVGGKGEGKASGTVEPKPSGGYGHGDSDSIPF